MPDTSVLVPGRPYLITWIDSAFIKGWQYPQHGGDLPEPRLINSLGYLMAEAKNYIVLSPNRTDDSEGVMNSLAIPRGCIQSFREVPGA